VRGDPAADVTDLARAYLAANCAQCHLPGGPTPVTIDLRYGVPSVSMGLINVAPSAGDVGLLNPYLVWPGLKESSVLWERMRVLDGNRMPNLGSLLIDQEALDIVGQWIDDGAQ
jgi:hypothetical protein